MKKYKTIKCKHCGSIFSSNKDEPLCPICHGQCNRKDKDATDFYKVEFKCPWCNRFVKFKKGMIRCPACNKIIFGNSCGEYKVSAAGDVLIKIPQKTADEAMMIMQYDLSSMNKFRTTDDKLINIVKLVAFILAVISFGIPVLSIISSFLK